jgi:hypothetical protein
MEIDGYFTGDDVFPTLGSSLSASIQELVLLAAFWVITVTQVLCILYFASNLSKQCKAFMDAMLVGNDA